MIQPKKLAQLARKWQRAKTTVAGDDEVCCASSNVTDKGHFVVYTAEGRRFEVPLVYLGTTIFLELLRMSQEEFGYTSDGKITLPFNAMMMEYIMCLLRRNASEEVERAFLSSVVMPCQYSSCTVSSELLNQQHAVCSS
ncbi:auxin-responsive protein SAUR36-like [Brachypodium distachyon]|uniref:auxin-responsive protein SAUR36-like n=1 Tax=Brachypodium distachyon TaxID=15368 RepID=UPI000D0D3737|nr:auxin-responsive protein SAUR36-like [Brachypodium distachyon]|eukprot:XP_024319144.1 auxin-responsive protein SAUR36-like [Brachypodium distachyon]